MPRMTYGQLYREFFPNAFSRSEIFDYRHSMHELLAVFEYVHAQPDNWNVTELLRRIDEAFKGIQRLRDEGMMVH